MLDCMPLRAARRVASRLAAGLVVLALGQPAAAAPIVAKLDTQQSEHNAPYNDNG